MLGYSEIDFEGVKVLTKNSRIKMGKNIIPLNMNFAIMETDDCELAQSRQSIVPQIKYQSKALGLQASLEKTIERKLRKFFIEGDAADLSDQELQKVAVKLIKVTSMLPPERISMFTIPVILVNSIKFMNKLGKIRSVDKALFVPTRGVSILILKKEKLEEMLSDLEEKLKF